MSNIKTIKTKQFWCTWFCLLALGLVIGGNIMATEENQKSVFVVTDGNESHFTVRAHEEFSIKIESNPTTGYSWSLQTPKESDDSLIKFKGQKVEEPGDRPKEEQRMGAPTYEIFTFDAQSPGNATIELCYRRPWEKNVEPIKKHKVIVTIN